MAKATLTTKDGTRVVIEGSPDEVQVLLGRIRATGSVGDVAKNGGKVRSKRETAGSLPSASDAILELTTNNFFSKPKGLADIKDELASKGVIYPVTTLSGVVLSLVRKRTLGRLKEKGRWHYVVR